MKFDETFENLITRVRVDRATDFERNPSAKSECSISELLKEIIDSGYYKGDYERRTCRLLNENMSYECAVENGIKIIQEKHIFG